MVYPYPLINQNIFHYIFIIIIPIFYQIKARPLLLPLRSSLNEKTTYFLTSSRNSLTVQNSCTIEVKPKYCQIYRKICFVKENVHCL